MILSTVQLLNLLKSSEKFLNISLLKFRILLKRICLFQVTSNHCLVIEIQEIFWQNVDSVMTNHLDSTSGKSSCLPCIYAAGIESESDYYSTNPGGQAPKFRILYDTRCSKLLDSFRFSVAVHQSRWMLLTKLHLMRKLPR